jgi:hypothetical protein
MTYIADIEASFLNYKEEVADSLNEARNYLSGFNWCLKIERQKAFLLCNKKNEECETRTYSKRA